MKFIAVIYSVFILYLVTVPCADEVIHIEKSKLEQSTPQGKPCNHTEQDGCSPFCVCACCGVVVVMNFINYDCQPNSFIKTEFLSFYKDFTSSFFQSFWQPPKLG